MEKKEFRKFCNTEMIEECLQRIETIQEHYKAVKAAEYFLREKRRYREDLDSGNLTTLLMDEELNEYRKLFMFGLTLEDSARERIKALAYQRFLRDGMCVADWLSPDGISPGQWWSAEEENFRTMVKKVFGPHTEDTTES